MTEYWIVKPDEIKNLDADSLSPLEFSNFRHGEASQSSGCLLLLNR